MAWSVGTRIPLDKKHFKATVYGTLKTGRHTYKLVVTGTGKVSIKIEHYSINISEIPPKGKWNKLVAKSKIVAGTTLTGSFNVSKSYYGYTNLQGTDELSKKGMIRFILKRGTLATNARCTLTGT